MEYVHIYIPKPLAERIKRVCYVLGYRGVAEVVIEATRKAVNRLESKYDDLQHDIEAGRKVLGKEEGEL